MGVKEGEERGVCVCGARPAGEYKCTGGLVEGRYVGMLGLM